MAKQAKFEEVRVADKQPLQWPEAWGRSLISDRKPRATWRKPFDFYREQVVKELERFGASEIRITRNERSIEKQDPGVAVWWSMRRTEDTTWQKELQIDNPLPTKDEINEAFKRLVMRHRCHPDSVQGGSGGDIKVYYRLDEARKKALSYVGGSYAPTLDNCIPCDRFTDARENLAGIASALRHFRGLETLGIPAILERVVGSAFKTALPQKASEEAHVGSATS